MTLTQINKAGLDEIALDHVFTIGASGSSAYTFQGEGLNGTVNNPTLYLTRGKTYRFENGSGGHPIRIQSTSGASGTAYNTGVTNNAGNGTVIVEVQHDAPDVLYYQCTSHAAMNGILYITGALADGGVTTAKIAADAVTGAKIADDAIDSEHYTDGSIDTAHIANDAVTVGKIQNIAQDRILGRQSSGSGDVQELNSANVRLMLNVADGATNSPTTTINNNADNRVITGSGTANTLNAESGVVVDSDGKVGIGNTSPTNTFDGAGLKIEKYQQRNTSYASPDGYYGASLGEVTNSTPKVWATVESHYAQANAVSAGLYLKAFHQDAGGSQAGFTIKNLKSGNDLTFSRVTTAANTGSPAVETERLRILHNGGITFNGDTAAANALDDYEEGTWTPFVGTQGGSDYTISSSYNCYTKIGNIVHAYFSYTFTAEGNGSISLFNLPFSADSNVTLIGQGYVTNGSTRLSLQYQKYTANIVLPRVDDGVNYQNYWTGRGSWSPTNTFVCHITYKV